MSEKNRFVRDYVIRLGADVDSLPRAVARALAVWDALAALGYAEEAPSRGGLQIPAPAPHAGSWDGPYRQSAGQAMPCHPAYIDVKAPKPEPSRADLIRDADAAVRHWERYAARRPDNEDIQFNLQTARDKRAALDLIILENTPTP